MIIQSPDPRLHKPVSKLPVPGEVANSVVMVLKDALDKSNNGVAVAANQVGLDLDMFVYYDEEKHFHVVLNPRILMYSEEMIEMDEGCLSIPGKMAHNHPRSEVITVTFTDYPTMKTRKYRIEGFTARIFQHECDHLNGILLF